MNKTFFAALLAAVSAVASAQDCRVVGVSDGDTLTCLAAGNKQIKVRLAQIDAPESRQAFGTAAKDKLSSLVYGKVVSLKVQDTDKYNRTVAEVFVGGINANKEMVRSGYAWAYRQYLKDQQYITLENQARAAKRGLWAEPNPINPSDFRKGVKRGTYTRSLTSTKSETATQPSASCGSKRTCGEMVNCAEAKFYLTQCKVLRLDRDGDGVPCEKICR